MEVHVRPPESSAERTGAAEVPVGESHDVITEYRKVAGRTVAPYWQKLPEDKDHPVFRLSPA